MLYQIRLHRNDINGGDGGDGSAVSLQLIAVGTRHCRLLACHSGAAGIDISLATSTKFWQSCHVTQTSDTHLR